VASGALAQKSQRFHRLMREIRAPPLGANAVENQQLAFSNTL
jgi:hypothetical protein